MKTNNSALKIILYVITALVLIAIVVIRLKSNQNTVQQRVYHYDQNQPVIVQADTIQLENADAADLFTGTFEPDKETRISAEIQGKINSIFVDIGSVVKKGQPLVQLDNSLLKLQQQSVEVQIEGLEADVKRYKILANADAVQGVQLEKAELGLKSAGVQKDLLIEQISKTTIKAPFDGVITAKISEEGAFAAPGMPLVQLTDISTLKFTVNVSENYLRRFVSKNSFTITADAFPDLVLTCKTVMVSSKANPGSSFLVQLSIANTPDLLIKAGMFGKLNLKTDNNAKQIIIPASAITGSTAQPQVYLAKNGIAVLQKIAISKRTENKVIVASGLNQGDVIITGGFINLSENAKITVK